MSNNRGSFVPSLLLGLLTALAFWSPQTILAQSNGVLLTGTVTSASGEKMSGVTVSAQAEGQPITTSVFTDAQGEYFFPRMAEQKYKVWAQAVGYEAGHAEINLNASVKRQDFALKDMKDFSIQLSGDQWMASLPEDTPEHVRMKDILRHECNGCHTPAFPLQNRFDEAGWTRILSLMSRISVFGGTVHEDQAPNPIIQYYKKRLAAYLTEMRGPGPSPVKFKVRPRPTGEAAMAVITEYETPLKEGEVYDSSDGRDWSLGHVSHLNPEHHHEHDALVDLKGNLWITDQSPNLERTIAKIDAKTGRITPFKVPGGKTPEGDVLSLGTHAMVRDEAGILWADVYTNPGGLIRMDPSTEQFEVLTPPAGSVGVGSWVNMDGLGRVWSNSGSGANMYDPETKKFTDFKAVTQLSPDGNTFGYGVTGDSQGNGWWSQISIDKIGFVNMKAGGKVDEIKLPPIKSAAVSAFTGQDREVFERSGAAVFNWGTPWSQAPRRMGGDLKSNVIYVPLWYGQSIAQINVNTKQVTKIYPIPTLDGGPYEARVDKNHMVWVDFQNSDTIGRLDPQTGKWTEYSLPTLGCETHGIGIQDAGPIQVTVACFRAGKIERLQLRTKEELQALKTETQKVAGVQ